MRGRRNQVQSKGKKPSIGRKRKRAHPSVGFDGKAPAARVVRSFERADADWHRANPMPKRPTEDGRLAHPAHCGCRPIPASVRRPLAARDDGIPDPAPEGRQRG
jgi:hypothetical protein